MDLSTAPLLCQLIRLSKPLMMKKEVRHQFSPSLLSVPPCSDQISPMWLVISHTQGGDRPLCTMTQKGNVKRPKSSASKSHDDPEMSLASP